MLLQLPDEIRLCVANSDPIAALFMLHLNRKMRREVEQQLYWMIVNRFLPKIVGLPHNLKPVYYVRLLRNYFLARPLHPQEWRPMDSSKIGAVILNSNDDAKALHSAIRKMGTYMLHTARGRAYMIGIVKEWKTYLESRFEEHDGLRLIAEIQQVLQDAFVIVQDAKLQAGTLGVYRMNQAESVDFTEFLL